MGEVFTEQCVRFIGEILRQAASAPVAERVFHLVVDRLSRIYHSQACAIILLDPRTEFLVIKNSLGISYTFSKQFQRKISTGPVGELVWTGKPVLIRSAAEDTLVAAAVKLEHDFASCALVPVASDHRSLGYLHIESARVGAFDERDLPFLSLFADIVALAQVRASLHEENLHLERYDRETGIEKYSLFVQRLREAIENARRFGESFALCVADVDNFKEVLRVGGYEQSKVFLRELAARLKADLRPCDSLCRFGVDEFLVLLPKTTMETSRELVGRLRSSVAEESFAGGGVRSTLSLGISLFPADGESVDDLIVKGKNALFEAQRAGGNRVHFLHESQGILK